MHYYSCMATILSPRGSAIRFFVRWRFLCFPCFFLLLWVSCSLGSSSFSLRNTRWTGTDPLSNSSVELNFTASIPTVIVLYGDWAPTPQGSPLPYSYDASIRQGSIALKGFQYKDPETSADVIADVIWLLTVQPGGRTMRLLAFSDADGSRQELILSRSS